ncbi:MAG: amino acid permease, partial [Proteobacteria bacterium]|nr:amino acid permease [Pseudomonadota bacterium]
ESVGVSPFALVFRNAGLATAAGVMNAVILTAVLSAGNSGMYASTRMLYDMARQGRAPRVFARLSRQGVPMAALVATAAVGAMCFLTTLFKGQNIYLWLLNASAITGFIVWLGIAVSHYRFRKGFLAQGRDLGELPYVSPFFPWGPIFAFALCLVVTLGQNYQALLGPEIDWIGLLGTYIGLPIFLAIWAGYRIKHRTRFVRYADMRFGARAIEPAQAQAQAHRHAPH